MDQVRRVEQPALPNFNRIARLYRWMEYLALGPLLERTREYFLPRLGTCRSALVLGDGDGRFTARMMAAHPEMRVHAVDLSPVMMKLLETRVARAGARARLRTTVGDALEFEPDRQVDLVVTHFFLDCLTQEQVFSLVKRLKPYLNKGGLWLVSDFQVPSEPRLRRLGQLLIRALYLAFRVLTGLQGTRVPAYRGSLQMARLVRVGEHLEMGGMLTTQLWQVLLSEDEEC